MKDFQQCQATWRDTSPKMCTDLITNTIVKTSQERLMRLKKTSWGNAHRATGDVLGLLTTVIDVHKYKGEIIDDRDRSRVKADLTKWGEGKISGNTTLSQYHPIPIQGGLPPAYAAS